MAIHHAHASRTPPAAGAHGRRTRESLPAAAHASSRSRRSCSGWTSSSSCSPTGSSTWRRRSTTWCPAPPTRRCSPSGWSRSSPACVVAVRAAHRRLPRRRVAGRHHRQPALPRRYYDVALRDFGLLVGALALARLARAFDRRGHRGDDARPIAAEPTDHVPPDRGPSRRGGVDLAGAERAATRPSCAPSGSTPPDGDGRHPAAHGARLRRDAHARARSTSPRSPTTRATTSWCWRGDIPVHSVCEHHMLPFVGVAHVGYLPGRPDPRPVQAGPGRRAVRPAPAGPGAADQAGRGLAAGRSCGRAASGSSSRPSTCA